MGHKFAELCMSMVTHRADQDLRGQLALMFEEELTGARAVQLEGVFQRDGWELMVRTRDKA